MGEYLRPDVYVERISNGVASVSSASTSTAGILGTSVRGKVGEVQLVTSWTEYVNKFAKGVRTPFRKQDDLAYSVYGFFQNGGSRAYVGRVTDGTAKKATATIDTSLEIEAKDEGTWANNNLKVEVVQTTTSYEVIVKLYDEIVEVYRNVNADPLSENYVLEVVNSSSEFITILSAPLLVVGTTIASGGTDGLATIEEAHYIGDTGLNMFDVAEDISLIAIPGQTSKAINQAIIDYCSTRKDCFAVIDMPTGMSTTEVITYKKSLTGNYGACYYPWGKIIDPVGKGKLRLTPPSGHVLGVYARTDQERGVHKAPAGLEAQVKGFVETERKLSSGDIEMLNPLGVNCIVAKPNSGVVIWGARILSPHLDRRYVSDMRLDINIENSIYEGTQWTTFEPNDEILWGKIVAQIKAFLYVKWSEGALFGTSPEEAFFVKCDEELNTPEVIASGRVIADIGYAKKTPAEFTIFRLSQKIATK